LKHLFMRNNMPPFYVENSFNADDLSEYFYQYITS